MEQHEVKEILNALAIHSKHVDEKLDNLKKAIDNRFDWLEKKFDGMSVDLYETQESVDYLSSKSLQHEKKLRALIRKKQK